MASKPDRISIGSQQTDFDLDFADASLAHIPKAYRIQILYLDSQIVVVSKPGHLRSVPGHAHNNDFIPTQPTGPRKRPRDDADPDDNKLSGQRAWIAAVQSFEQADILTEEIEPAQRLIIRLARIPPLVSSLPRKWTVFLRYIHRNKLRLGEVNAEEITDEIVKEMFERIQERYRAYLPEPTKPEDSALGQLKLLGIARTDQEQRSSQPNELYVVHRLDCETSGVMVFARTQSAASVLGKNWRQRDTVNKIYLAHLGHWPPLHNHGEIAGSIHLPLKPSTERIKWQTCSQTDEGARQSKTLWRVHQNMSKDGPVVLELTPVTGRTHQLRIHCAAVGSGITGDSLYGGNSCSVTDMSLEATEASSRLCLHALKLSFPHPLTEKVMDFIAEPPSWLSKPSAT